MAPSQNLGDCASLSIRVIVLICVPIGAICLTAPPQEAWPSMRQVDISSAKI